MGYQGSKIYDIIITFMTSEVFMVNVYSTVTDTIGKEFPSLAYNYYRYDNVEVIVGQVLICVYYHGFKKPSAEMMTFTAYMIEHVYMHSEW